MQRSRLEAEGSSHEIGRLPAGCLVIHAPERGASREFALAAARCELPMMIVPRDALVEVVLAVQDAGWTIKVLVAGGDPEIVDGLGRAGVFVSEVVPWVPWVEPDPEPGPDSHDSEGGEQEEREGDLTQPAPE